MVTDLISKLLDGGRLYTTSEIARIFPSDKTHGDQRTGLNPSVVWRWACQGIKAIDGKTVKLETVRVGGRLLTSRDQVIKFIERLNGQKESESNLPSSRTPLQRKVAAQKAIDELQAIGA